MFAYFCLFLFCLFFGSFSLFGDCLFVFPGGGRGGGSVLLFSLFFADCSFVCRLSGTEVLSKKKLKVQM